MIQIGVFSFDLDLEPCLSTYYSTDGMGLMGGDWSWLGEHFVMRLSGITALLRTRLQPYSRANDTKFYTLGCKSLHIATDHQPLVATLGNQSVADVPIKMLAWI